MNKAYFSSIFFISILLFASCATGDSPAEDNAISDLSNDITVDIGIDALLDQELDTMVDQTTVDLTQDLPIADVTPPDQTVDKTIVPDLTVDKAIVSDQTIDTTYDTSIPNQDLSTTTPTIVINEIMADPDGAGTVSDSEGEWIELYNTSTVAVDLKGWKLIDDGSNSFEFTTSTLIQPHAYLLVGANSNSSVNGGINGLIQWNTSNYQLANKDDEVVLVDSNGNTVFRVAYDATWVKTGSSISLKSPSLDPLVQANWCTETTAWTGSAGDFGSPGAAPNCN